MGFAELPAPTQARVRAVLNGPVQRVHDAWAELSPLLAPVNRRFAEAIQSGDAGRIEFAYRRAEGINRRVGALLEAIAAAVQAVEGLAELPGIEAAEGTLHIVLKSLGGQKRTLVAHLRAANKLEAQAQSAQKAARRRDASTDADWERLRARLADTERRLDEPVQEMRRLAKRADGGPARTSAALIAQIQQDAAACVARAPEADVAALQRELDRIAMLVERDLVRSDFAVQWRREQADVARQIAQMKAAIVRLRADLAEIAKLRAQVDAAAIARLFGVPVAAVRGEEKRLAGDGREPLAAVTAIAERAKLDRAPKELLGLLRREGWVA